jgi:Protein of unknown function DUF262
MSHENIVDIERSESKTDFSLSLRQIAAWRFPELVGNKVKELPLCAGIPSLQRGAVWDPDQVELLWDSIFRGFPIGSLVVCAKIPTQKTRHGRYGKGWPEEEIDHHLLDGHQRSNAIALGFRDPFEFEGIDQGAVPPPVLWLDLLPPEPMAGSTRKFLFRILTTAHPWGYKRNDRANRLSLAEIREALEQYGVDRTASRPHPDRCWPPVGLTESPKSAAIPLAWLLNPDQQLDRQTLWAEIIERCGKYDEPWAKAASETIKSKTRHLNLIAQGLAFAKKLRIVALEVPQ